MTRLDINGKVASVEVTGKRIRRLPIVDQLRNENESRKGDRP
jgi:hypothetical protein